MQIAARLTSLTGGGSDGWDLYRRANAMTAAGEPVVHLTIGEHDIRTDPSILAAMDAAARAGNTGYTFGAGLPALRDRIAARVHERTGVPTARENVVLTAGGQGGLFGAHAAACDPGDVALYIDPYYATYPGTIRAVGAVPRAVAARPEDGFQPRAEAIAAAVCDRSRSLLVNTPHNPTGAVYGVETLEGIARVCRDRDLWLISDEVYDTMVWQGRHLSPRALPGMAERTIVVGSMSKSHAMTGSRLGWLVAPAAVVEAVTGLATNTTYGLPGFIQEAALFALSQGPALEEAIAAPFRRRRDLALRILRGARHLPVVPADGAMYLMLDIRATGLTGETFAHALLDAERIAVMPGESFGTAAAGHVRIALTVADDILEDALQRLLRFAERTADAA